MPAFVINIMHHNTDFIAKPKKIMNGFLCFGRNTRFMEQSGNAFIYFDESPILIHTRNTPFENAVLGIPFKKIFPRIIFQQAYAKFWNFALFVRQCDYISIPANRIFIFPVCAFCFFPRDLTRTNDSLFAIIQQNRKTLRHMPGYTDVCYLSG